MIINFRKTGLTIDDIKQAFTSQDILKFEIMVPFTNTDNTKSGCIFINSLEWTGKETCVLTFTSLFKFDWMIPGIYRLNLDEGDLEDNNQKWAIMVPIRN